MLVPLCGKSVDLLWLAERGHAVTGVELSPVAVQAFFEENGLAYTQEPAGELLRYFTCDKPIEIYCGDYFALRQAPFDAVFDRGALVALPAEQRPAYAAHTRSLLRDGATQLLLTLSYEQAKVDGPPFSVMPEEAARYWPTLTPISRFDALETCPPKFRAAGLNEVIEIVWQGEV